MPILTTTSANAPPETTAETTHESSHEAIIAIEGLINRFGEQAVHDGLSLAVTRGEILGIVGGSGTGKSVLLRCIIGLRQPTAGHIRVFGEDITRMEDEEKRRLQRRWGVLFQSGALFSSLTVAENIMLPIREHTGVSTLLARELAAIKLSLVGLPEEAGAKFPSELSGGMIKRAALARALALDPELLFLDEPTAGLDPIAAAGFDTLIRNLQQNLGLTVVMVTHDLDSLYTICDRVAVLVNKRIQVDRIDVLEQSDHPWIREYFLGPRGRAASHVA